MPAAPFRVNRAVFSTGERFPVILTDAGLPLSLPTRYLIDRHRDSKQANTLEVTLIAISYFYRWASGLDKPFDPEIRLRSGPLLASDEAIGLARYLRAGRQSDVLVFAPKAVRKRNGTVISNNDLNKQLARTRDFLAWAAEFARSPRATGEQIEDLKKRLDAQILASTKPGPKYGLSPALQSRLLDIVHVAGGENPFNTQVRFRNQVIVTVLLETGIRRGELCKLRIEDVNFADLTGAFIVVERNPDDKWDSRRREPQVKTYRRCIPIRRELKNLLFEYLRKHRGKCRHPYLFTSSRKSVPLDASVINRIFSAIRKSSAEFESLDLTPHTLRRTFEDNLLKAANALGLKDDKVNKTINYLSGWTEESKQAGVYQRKVIEEWAMEAMEKLHEQTAKIYAAGVQKLGDDIFA